MNQWNAIAALSAAADVLKGWDDGLAKDCLEMAKKAWDDEKAHPTPFPSRAVGSAAGIRRLLLRRVCWLRLRAWWPTVVVDAAARVLRPLAPLALRQHLRPAPAVAGSELRRTGLRRWN